MNVFFLCAIISALVLVLLIPTACRNRTKISATEQIRLGNIKLWSHDFRGAIASYSIAIEAAPSDPQAYHCRAQAELWDGDFVGAKADYSKVTELDPHNIMAFMGRGEANWSSGNFAESGADYEKVLQADETFPYANCNLGGTLYARGKLKESLAAFRRATRLDMLDVERAQLFIWLARSMIGESIEANKEFADYLAANPMGNPEQWEAKLYNFIIEQSSALELLSSTSSKDPAEKNRRKCQALFYISVKSLLRGEISSAVESFNECLATDQRDKWEYHFARFNMTQTVQ
jgi:tetratricopeptide (TPR) repeat protein